MAHDLILSRAKLGTFMLTTYPDIYAAQRHRVQAVEPPSWDIIAPPFTASPGEHGWVLAADFIPVLSDLAS